MQFFHSFKTIISEMLKKLPISPKQKIIEEHINHIVRPSACKVLLTIITAN